jgi:hypothetical protein
LEIGIREGGKVVKCWGRRKEVNNKIDFILASLSVLLALVQIMRL